MSLNSFYQAVGKPGFFSGLSNSEKCLLKRWSSKELDFFQIDLGPHTVRESEAWRRMIDDFVKLRASITCEKVEDMGLHGPIADYGAVDYSELESKSNFVRSDKNSRAINSFIKMVVEKTDSEVFAPFYTRVPQMIIDFAHLWQFELGLEINKSFFIKQLNCSVLE